MRQADRVAGHLAGVERAVPLTDQDPGNRQLIKELVFGPCSGRRPADMPAQRAPGRLIPAAPDGLLRSARLGRLGAVRSAGGVV